jgi:acetyltransferase
LLADAREDRFGMVFERAMALARDRFDCVLGLHVVPFMVDAAPVVAALAAAVRSAGIPMMHAMMGTLEDKDAWFGTLADAGIVAFDDGEEMAIAAGYCARYAALQAS